MRLQGAVGRAAQGPHQPPLHQPDEAADAVKVVAVAVEVRQRKQRKPFFERKRSQRRLRRRTSAAETDQDRTRDLESKA